MRKRCCPTSRRSSLSPRRSPWILADRDPDTHENRYPRLELLRLAIPRRVYSDNHIRVIAAACRNIYERRAEITTGYRITFEAPILRHFTVELDKI